MPHADRELFADDDALKNSFLNWQQDPHGNFLARFVFPEKAREFSIEVDLVAEMTVINPFDFFFGAERAEQFPFGYDPLLAERVEAVSRGSRRPDRCSRNVIAESIARDKMSSVDFLVDI